MTKPVFTSSDEPPIELIGTGYKGDIPKGYFLYADLTLSPEPLKGKGEPLNKIEGESK